MKLQQIFEARRNPEMNPRIGPFGALEKYEGEPDIFVTMTSVLKVGVNPKAVDNTPFGIYSYPLSYVMSRGPDERGFPDVPYRGNAEYFTIFQQKGTNLDLELYSKADLQYDINEFKKEVVLPFVQETKSRYGGETAIMIVDRMLNEGLNVTMDHFTDFETRSDKETEEEDLAEFMMIVMIKRAKVETPGGMLWSILHFSSLVIGGVDPTDPRLLFRQWCMDVFGFDSITDRGRGIIHENEPSQAVHFTTRTINVLETVENNRRVLYKESQERLIYDGDALSIRKAEPSEGDVFYYIYGDYYTKEPTHQFRGLEPYQAYKLAREYGKSLTERDLEFLHDFSDMELNSIEELRKDMMETIDKLEPPNEEDMSMNHLGIGTRFEKVLYKFAENDWIGNLFFTFKLETQEYRAVIDEITDAFEDKGFDYVAERVRRSLQFTEHHFREISSELMSGYFLHVRNNIVNWITDEAKGRR